MVVEDAILDIGVVRWTPKDIQAQMVEAKPEHNDIGQKLMPSISEAEIAEVRSRK